MKSIKQIKQISFIGLIIIFVMNSCTTEKRIYSSGYHINWKNSNRNSSKQELIKDNLGKQTEQNQFVTIVSSKNVTNTINNAPKVIDGNFITSNVTRQIYLPKKEKIKFYSRQKVIMADGEIKINYAGKTKIINEIINFPKNTDTESKMSGMAITGFICSFLGLLLFMSTGFPFIFGTLGIIFSAIGLRQTSKKGKKGKRFAITGLAIGILIVLAFWVILYSLFTSLRGLNNVPF